VVACLLAGIVGRGSPAFGQAAAQGAARAETGAHSSLELLMPDVVSGRAALNAGSAVIEVDTKLQHLVDDLLSRSLGFRRQWQRLVTVSRLTLRIQLVHDRHTGDAHAVSTIASGGDGALRAVVAIPSSRRMAELLAHEIEHVLEHIDGVSVADQHAVGDRSVRRGPGTFETARAVLVGQLVAAEIRR
jgi:hypothetical protein